MARKRSELSEPVRQPRAAVTVPDVFKIGACTEVWSDSGHRFDLGSASGRHSRARMEWERAEGLDTATACAIAPVSGPWSVEGRAERLAKLGFTEADIPRLRRAAQQRVNDTDPTTRRTP